MTENKQENRTELNFERIAAMFVKHEEDFGNINTSLNNHREEIRDIIGILKAQQNSLNLLTERVVHHSSALFNLEVSKVTGEKQ